MKRCKGGERSKASKSSVVKAPKAAKNSRSRSRRTRMAKMTSRSLSPAMRRTSRRVEAIAKVSLGTSEITIVSRTNDLFGNAVGSIYRLLVNNICRDQVDPDYVEKSLRRRYEPITHVAVLTDSTEAKAFLTMMKEGSKVFIDVICSQPGFGKTLILGVLKWIDDNRVTDVELHALPGVLFYYQQYGFNFRKSCTDAPTVFGAEDKSLYLAQKIQFFNEAQTNPIAVQYLKMLQEQNLNIKKEKCPANASAKDIADNNCARDGYEMHRCN